MFDGAVVQLGERLTGSQKVRGSSPLSSTKEAKEANKASEYLSIGSNSCTQLAIPLDRLIDGLPLSGEYLNIDYVKRLLGEHGGALSPRQVMKQKRVTSDYSMPLSFIVAFELFLRLLIREKR